MRLTFFIDRERRMLVGGLNDPTPAVLPPLMQGDTVDVVLQGVEKQSETAVQYYRPVPISFSGIKVAITSGADVPPTDGTIRLALVGGATGDVTDAFGPSITKPALETKLNALPGVIAKGGVKVLTTNTAKNIFRVRWNNSEETALFEFRENLLEPTSDTRSYTVPLPNGQMQLLKYRQLPIAFTDQFALPVAPTVTTASVRTGTNARNCIQSITVPRAAVGSVHFTFAGLGTAILPVTALNTTSIAAALNALYADGAARFSVTLASSTVFYVEFVGPLALTDYPVLDATMHDQVPLDTPVGRLPLGGPTLEMAFDGTARIERLLEIEITDAGGEVGTPIQAPVTLRNDVIDGGMALAADPAWQEQIDPTYPVYDPENGPTVTGWRCYVTPIGVGVGMGTAGTSFVIPHNLGTKNCHVTVRETGGSNQRLPDNNYVTTYLNDDQIQVDFPVAPTDGQYEVIVSSAVPQDLALPGHHHVISDVDGLEEALENLGGETSTAPIPQNRLPARIPWYNLDEQGKPTTLRFDKFLPDELLAANVARLVNGRLPTANLPLGVPYLDDDGNLVVDLPGPPPRTVVLLDSTGHIPVGTLPVDPSNWPGLITAILKALQNGAPSPAVVTFHVPDFADSFPPQLTLKLPSGGQPSAAALPTLSIPSSVLPAMFNVTNGGNVTGGLQPPKTSFANKYFTVVGSASSSATVYRARQAFSDGQIIGCNGRHWYGVTLDGGTAYPSEYNRDLANVAVLGDMLSPGSRFALNLKLRLQLATTPTTTRGQYLFLVEIGQVIGLTGNGIGVNYNATQFYQTVISERIVLTAADTEHSFSYAVSSAASTGARTAQVTKYGQVATVAAPVTGDFVVRVSLSKFDVEDVVSNNPLGSVKISMKDTTATIFKL